MSVLSVMPEHHRREVEAPRKSGHEAEERARSKKPFLMLARVMPDHHRREVEASRKSAHEAEDRARSKSRFSCLRA